MHTFPAGAVGPTGVPVQPASVPSVVGLAWPSDRCPLATLPETSASPGRVGAGTGKVTSMPKSLALSSYAWKSPPTAPRIVLPLGSGSNAASPRSPLSPLSPFAPGAPGAPGAPVAPAAPAAPFAPGAPVAPAAPVSPFAPGSPVAPREPRKPRGPRGPAGPRGPRNAVLPDVVDFFLNGDCLAGGGGGNAGGLAGGGGGGGGGNGGA